jgi:N6-adenosine-specific RNA methylase IME4
MQKFDVLLADPPWKQGKGGKKAVREHSSGGLLEYQVLDLITIKDILAQATALTADNSTLFLWTIDKYLFEAQQIAESLDFKLHARMIWNKIVGIPAAFTVRFGHEYPLFMYRGKFTPIAPEERGRVHTVFTERPIRHSQKPEIAYQIIERFYPEQRKLELFARQSRAGWTTLGNELDGQDIRIALHEQLRDNYHSEVK